MTTCAQAIKNFETLHTVVATEVDHVKLYCQQPPIAKMDAALNSLVNCERLALSTNTIDRIISLSGLSKLKILSLGRNAIKKVSEWMVWLLQVILKQVKKSIPIILAYHGFLGPGL